MATIINASTSAGLIQTADTSGSLALQTSGTTAVTIDTSQNVGIGTTPSYPLDVKASASGATTLNCRGRTSDNYSLISFSTSAGTLNSYLGSPDSTYLTFYTNGFNERMRIDSSGNVGIGTSSPNTKFTVNGNANLTGNLYTPDYGYIGNSGGTFSGINTGFQTLSGGSGYLLALTNGTERMRIDSSGNLLIGYTSSNGSYKLQVNSQIFATSSTIATSDARYKENVEELSGALDIVKSLRPVSFDWKVHPIHNFDTKTKTVGFLAQDVQQTLAGKPYLNSIIKTNECVIEPEVKDENGTVTKEAVTEEFLGIAEGNMISILTAAIKELKAEFDAYVIAHP